MQVEQVSYETPDSQAYGFIVYNRSGYSLPKGMYSSYVAHHNTSAEKTYIEFSIASPTGDSSDHHNYTYPCANFAQAKRIVEMHGHMVNMWIMEDTTI